MKTEREKGRKRGSEHWIGRKKGKRRAGVCKGGKREGGRERGERERENRENKQEERFSLALLKFLVKVSLDPNKYTSC